MQTLNQDIKEKTFKRVYLLFGDEPFLVNSYKKRLREAIAGDDTMNYNYFEGKGPDVKEIISLADTMPFFAERRLVMVDGSGFFKNSAPEELVNYIAEIPESTCMVFVESDVDKRSKAYKAIAKAGSAVDFSMPDERMLTSWMMARVKAAGKTMTRDAWNEFFERSNDSMDHMDMEMEKLLSYVYDKDGITLEDVEAICTEQVHTKVFDMISFVASKNLPKVLDLYHDMLATKEPPIRILALIIRQFDQMYVMKDMASQGMNVQTIAGKMGIRDFIVRKNLGLARNFTMEQIRALLEDAADLDERAKTGRINDQLAVEMLMIKWAG